MTFVKMPALRDNVKVFYRIFPTEQQSTPHIRLDRDSRKIFVRNLQELSKKFLEEKTSYWEFDSDGLFANVEQDVIYSEVVSGVVENVANGYTSVIIAYGQSSSGKTFTVGGLHFTEEDFGILPRAVKHLFYIKSLQPKNAKMSIYISCLEFDGKFAVDLLKEVPNIVNLYKTKDATKIKISTEYEALKYIFIAEGRKTFAENCEGYLSNIYTSVVTFHVTLKNSDLTDPRELISRLHIIDLAGNDYAANRGRFSKRSNQIGGANVTKSNLEQFVICLRENTQHSVKLKYRSHCLLYYLDGDLSNNNMLRFIGHIKTSKQDLKLTISTLRFGNLVMGLKPQRKYVNNGELKMHYLNEAHLNPELLNEDLTGALNEENIFHIDRTIEEFLKNNINEITLMNVADAAVALKKLRELCQQYENEIKQLREATSSRSEASLKQEMLQQEQGSQIESGTKVSSKKMSRKSKGSATNDLRSSGNASTDVSFSQTLINTTQQTPSQDKNRPSLESVGKYDSTSSYRNSYPSSPEKVCDVEDMWKIFSSQSSCYRETLEEYKRNETYIHDSYRIFLDEVKKMQKLKSHVDKCIIELITQTMQPR
ncbi:kinesin-like protein KIF9 isoform X2 [Cylas formicarius]|uniref:kinesin-like protein KIF9 isoform X2 n=1 Tax=Cylas formicarius TaxID=197179 RepID=UPI0029588C17|nr:kinesin-like protein KIF9 isoform X2 [Cylas formicarius]